MGWGGGTLKATLHHHLNLYSGCFFFFSLHQNHQEDREAGQMTHPKKRRKGQKKSFFTVYELVVIWVSMKLDGNVWNWNWLCLKSGCSVLGVYIFYTLEVHLWHMKVNIVTSSCQHRAVRCAMAEFKMHWIWIKVSLMSTQVAKLMTFAGNFVAKIIFYSSWQNSRSLESLIYRCSLTAFFLFDRRRDVETFQEEE